MSLRATSENVILNQFSAFSELSHPLSLHRARLRPRVCSAERASTTATVSRRSYRRPARPERLRRAITSKRVHGTKIAAVEAIECPTMLENGYGEHNIQGIGDKHIPLIHNVMNTDFVIGVSDRGERRAERSFHATRSAAIPARPPERRSGSHPAIRRHRHVRACEHRCCHQAGQASWTTAPNDVVMTVATDSARAVWQRSEAVRAATLPDGFGDVDAGGCLCAASRRHRRSIDRNCAT